MCYNDAIRKYVCKNIGHIPDTFGLDKSYCWICGCKIDKDKIQHPFLQVLSYGLLYLYFCIIIYYVLLSSLFMKKIKGEYYEKMEENT